jgi:hypothetical protein
MKKIILFLAVLLLVALPATAKVTVTAAQTNPWSNEVTISYNVDGADATLGVVAFALDITADNGAKIGTITGYKTGESTSGSKGYGIFPGSIEIDGNVASATYGQVLNYGNPVADVNDPDGPGQLNSSAIVVELGALYDHSANPSAAPATSGTLCKVTVDGDCNVCPSVNSYRGGIVMEDGTAPSSTEMVCGQATWPPCGTCPWDSSSWQQGVPDLWVGPEDVSYMVTLLTPYSGAGYYCDAGVDVNCPNCLDFSSWQSGVPDGWLGPEDLSYLISILSPAYSSTGYYAPCGDAGLPALPNYLDP